MSTNWLSRASLQETYCGIHLTGPSATTQFSLALDSAYTYGSAGDAYTWGFVALETANLTDLYVKVVSYTGTWASTDGVINFTIREGLNGTRIPGTTIVGSGTITLDGSTTGWIKKSGLSISLTAGKLYFIVVYDADGGATNYVTMAIGTNSNTSGVDSIGRYGTTSNGFSTAYVSSGGLGCFVVKVGSSVLAGGTFDSIATVTSGTYERGMYFIPDEDCTLIGVMQIVDVQQLFQGNTLNLYNGTTAPGGSTLLSYTTPSTTLGGASSDIPLGVSLPTPYDLTANTAYRLVMSLASAATTPRKCSIGGSPDSTILAASIPFDGNCYWTHDNSGSWSDDTAAMCQFGPILVPKTAVSSTGLIKPNMSMGGIHRSKII